MDADSDKGPEQAVVRLGGADGLTMPAKAVIMALAILLAFIVVFPSLRGYLSQRARYDAVVDQIAESRATSSALEDEAARWKDDDYVRSQARERLSYVMPGETTYIVVGADRYEDGAPGSSATEAPEDRRPWYETLRESVRTAGGAPEPTPSANPAQRGWATPSPTPTAAPAPTQAPVEP